MAKAKTPKRHTMGAQAKQRIDGAKADASPRVVAHPSFRQIPPCLFPLSTDEAKREYDTISRALFHAGRLTLDMHRTLSSYAIQFDTITKASTEGKQVRGSWFVQMDKARAGLKLDDLDKPIAAPQDAPTNKFTVAGFASRRR